MKKAASPIRRWAPRVAVLSVAGLTLTSLYAFKVAFPHSGEEALKLVPATALLAATIDLDPTPQQALTFKKINDSLSRNHIADSVEGMIKQMGAQSAEEKEILDLAGHSATACLLESADQKEGMGGALLVPLTDSARAQEILTSKGRSEFWKGTHYYRLANSKVGLMVEGNTLVGSPMPWVLHEMALVSKGQVPPITQAKGFADARAKEPSDSTLFVLISPKLMEKGKEFAKFPNEWATGSITVQSGGVAFAMHGKSDLAQDQSLAKLASTKPLRPDLLQVLPEGAYGIVALSQPSNYFDAAKSSMNSKDVSKTISEGEKSVRDATGIDVENDVLPAFKGDAIFAAYPSQAPTAGADLLVVVDNQNNANPEDLAQKFQAFVDREAAKGDGPGKNWMTKVDRSDVSEYRLSEKIEKEVLKDMHGGSSDPIRYDILTSHKTVAWATVNGAVMLASSQEMLDKAIASYQGKSAALASDQAIAPAANPASGAQTVAVVNFARVAEGVKNTLDSSKMNADSRKQFKKILGMFEALTVPFSVQATVTPDGAGAANVFIPLEFDKIIDMFGDHKKTH